MSSGRTGHRRRNRPSPADRLNRFATVRRSRPSFEVLPKCLSEPLFFPANDVGSSDSGDGGLIFRLETWNDLFSYPSELSVASSQSPLSRRTNSFQGYERDSKVVITVTVEGSPGPIRALVKLGATVEDTIKLVIQKYEQEGRTPSLYRHASSSFDLHLSYFTLQCLDRRNAIGEVGSRSFYLRKNKEVAITTSISSFSNSEIIPLPEISPKQSTQPSSRTSPMAVLPWFRTPKMSKFLRRLHRLFKLFDCLHSI